MIDAARAALAASGGAEGAIRPVAERENAVFEVSVAGARAALRRALKLARLWGDGET